MNKFVLVVAMFAFGVIPGVALAQSLDRQVYDPFNDNALEWSEPDGLSLTFLGGQLRIESHTSNLGNTWRNFDAPQNGYVVAVTTTHVAGDTTYPYGLCFGGSDYDNEYFFVIGDDGTFKVGKFEKMEWTSFVDWTETDALHGGQGATNQLLVRAQGTWKFYLNGVLVYSMPGEDFFGGNAGLVVENEHTVLFDDFMVGTFKSGYGNNVFVHKFSALLDDFKNNFANSVGDSVQSDELAASVMPEWKVKDTLPEFSEQYFVDVGNGVVFGATTNPYPSRGAAMDEFLKVRDWIWITRSECLLWDAGETLEDGVIEGNHWLSLDPATGQQGLSSKMYVSLNIQHPEGEGGEKKWQLRLGITPLKK